MYMYLWTCLSFLAQMGQLLRNKLHNGISVISSETKTADQVEVGFQLKIENRIYYVAPRQTW